MTTTLVEGGHVVSMDPELGEFADGDVLIDGGEIVDVGPDLSADADVTIDATGDIVVPGFIDPHVHLYHTPLRGTFGNQPIRPYLDAMHGPIDVAYRPSDMFLGTRVGAAEQLDAGVTTVFDFCHNVRSRDHADRAIAGLESAGIRAIFGHGPPNGADVRDDWYQESERRHPEYINDLVEAHNDSPSLVGVGMAARGPDFSTMAVTRDDLATARELGIPVSMHAGVEDYPGYDPERYLDLVDDGLLGEGASFVHAIDLPSQVRSAFAEAGVGAITTPEPELHFGEGIPATGEFLEEGMAMGVGVDSVVVVSGELFTQVRFALQLQRGFDTAERLEAGREVRELSLTTRDALGWITIDAARTIGMADEVGSLSPGKRGDVVVISGGATNTTPSHRPLDAVVLQAGVGNVRAVVVDGDVVKEDGRLLDPPSTDEYEALRAAGARLARAGNLDSTVR